MVNITSKEQLQEEVRKNLRRVEEGKPLTTSLKILDGEFKRAYFTCLRCGCEIKGLENNIDGLCVKCRRKKWIKNNDAKFKKYNREYQREYSKRPYVRKKAKKWKKANRERIRVYFRNWQRKKYNIPKSRWKVN